MALVLSVLVLLSIGCAPRAVGKEYKPSPQTKILTIQNKTFIKVFIGITTYEQNPKEIFFKEFAPGEIAYVESELFVLGGKYVACWAGVVKRVVNCERFEIDLEHLHNLFDKEPDVWVTRSNLRNM
jgi:hypothetical protein